MTKPIDEFDRLDKQIDDLQYTKDIIDKIVLYKDKLEGLPREKLNDNQKLWLLAHEASEKNISTSSKDQIIEDMFLLLKFIPDNE